MRARAETATPAAPATSAGQGVPPVGEGSAAPAYRETESQRRRKTAVLAMIRFPWKKLGYEIAFLGPRPGYRAMTIADKRRIEIYMRPGESALMQAYDLAHELGHAFDLEYNNSERRLRWLQLRGINLSTPWFGCNRCPDYSTPAGDFAETFALLLLGPGNYHSRMSQPPTSSQIRKLAAFCQAEGLGGDGRQASADIEDELNH